MPRPLRCLLTAAALTLAACAGGCGPDQDAGPAQPTSVPLPSEGELEPGWDESPDSPATADSELSLAELVALLRVPATVPADDATCAPQELRLRLGPGDAAMGHRYSTVVATNTSQRSCALQGYPGIGARGEWGSAFLLEAAQQPVAGLDDPDLAADPPPVTVAPGAEAVASIEWTGELAGAESEWASVLVVQIAAETAPLLVPAELGEPAPGPVDIGMMSTVRIGWWRAPTAAAE